MKISPKKKRAVIIAGTLFAATAVPGFALFGLGDIVFDPTAYAQMLIQKSQQVAELAKLESQLQTMYKTYATLQKSYDTSVSTYNSIHANAQRFTLKTMWKPFLLAAQKEVDVESRNGEADAFSDALNKVSSVAGKMAWKQGGVGLHSNTTDYLSAETVGDSARLSQLASIEASDAISPACLSAVGSYNEARRQNSAAQAALADSQFDATDDTNSEIEQLNLLNASEAQRMVETQAQGALHSCLAAQMTVTNMQQRNAAAQDLNTWAFVKQQRAANPSSIDNSSYTWTHYIP